MEEAIRYGVMAAFMKATGSTVKLEDEVDSYTQMEKYMKVIGRTISHMAMEVILRPMVPFIRGSGITIKNTDKASKNGQMEHPIKEVIKKARKLVLANLHGHKDPCTKGIF